MDPSLEEEVLLLSVTLDEEEGEFRFDEILRAIRQGITKQYTNWQRPISPEERLAIMLRIELNVSSSLVFRCISVGFPRVLSTGGVSAVLAITTAGLVATSSLVGIWRLETHFLKLDFRVSSSMVGKIVLEICLAIWNNMRSQHMPRPSRNVWHVFIKCPDNAGSSYYDYLERHSVVLLAIVAPEYKFLCVDIGAYGRNSDGGIFEESQIGRKFMNDDSDLLEDLPLSRQTEPMPHIIGDKAFGLKPYLMRPFPYMQSKHDIRKEKYSYNLCCARRVVENCFGILAMKWRSFLIPIELKKGNLPSAKALKTTYIECNRRIQAVHALGEDVNGYDRVLDLEILREREAHCSILNSGDALELGPKGAVEKQEEAENEVPEEMEELEEDETDTLSLQASEVKEMEP
ncbi:hypothetical protein B7P43_G03664 [Cryptotermes secundus]|uniref:DDE Tnp4 domain-containing protein n=1 Tax=Cryptotermes secundus TaxID=105785 RepID=A0A2J7Q3L1_9NEOP|nr:hypothetical protein B7P43_G03664 [Cryptotermes secundus]